MPQDLAAAMARTFLPQQRAPRLSRGDVLLALGMLALQSTLAVSMPPGDGRAPGAVGWLLLVGSSLLVMSCRWAPGLTMFAMIALVAPYHAQDYVHTAVVPASFVALYSLSAAGPPVRSFVALLIILGALAGVTIGMGDAHDLGEMLRISGWLVACVLVGESVRIHRNYIAAIVERAERAERTREEEAARRVAQERLRIARDLHDLLAHSITLIGVQTSVAAHVLVADPERLDREAVAKALDGISDTCRDARAELRTTLEVLRADDTESHGPLPGLSGLPDLARAAKGAGAHVELTVHDTALAAAPPAAVSAAAYRIVQEAFTNAVRHAGAAVRIRAAVEAAGGGLRISVRDDGGEPRDREVPPGEGGFGIVGMRERARSVGGTLEAGFAGPGFQVTAHLPFDTTARREATA
ncbi:histidine kinase [Streptomyces albiaxialis]|uniref:histidine kinase n=1 Tax=Streptomyces albiaxialis TaxID=329523 RepID=A0ABP5HWL2_9ACTN